jgi:DNA repair exonuclease SbcCD ATPase subunit
MALLDMFRVSEFKLNLKQVTSERDDLKAIVAATGALELAQIKKKIEQQQQRSDELQVEIAAHKKEIERLQGEAVILEDEVLIQSFGLYKPRYEFTNSAAYKLKLDVIREKQASMIKSGTAAHCPTSWTINNDKKEGERMVRDFGKIILRAFNSECDTAILGAKFSNLESIEKRIHKAFDMLNKLGGRMSINIVPEYLSLKLEELHLAYEYQVMKKEEKEEQKRLREQMREEAKLAKEIEEARSVLEKEEKHFKKALASLDARLARAQTDAERQVLLEERELINEKLDEVTKNKAEIDYREQNTRAGYVYVISNVGAFGEGIYKIGVTRRLDPYERVDELSDASVPYDFDVHAIVFSDDAPALENALHKTFASTRLNLVNLRREFFRASIDDIDTVIRENFKKPVDLIRLADAAEFRQSELLRLEKSCERAGVAELSLADTR